MELTLEQLSEVEFPCVPTLEGALTQFLVPLKGKAVSRYPWLTPQFYPDLLQTLLSRVYTSLEWSLNSPPKPYAFTSLPLQSGVSIR